jgi:hypothetical protein
MKTEFIGLVLLVFLGSKPCFAQTTSVDCLPPLVPVSEASARLIEEFENEIRTEFIEYFDDAQRYLNCLNAAQRSGNADINAALSRYRVLFPDG